MKHRRRNNALTSLSTPNPAKVEELKSAVRAGKFVYWRTAAYRVIVDSIGQWLIKCEFNGHCIGLTWRDGVTLNGKPEDFHVCDERPRAEAAFVPNFDED